MEKITDFEKLNILFSKYFIRGSSTNNYILSDTYKAFIEKDILYYVCTEHNACFLVKYPDFYQLYYFINDLNDPVFFNSDLPVVMEILYRGEANRPKEIMSFWNKCNFGLHLTRDNMVATGRNISKVSVSDHSVEVRYANNDDEVKYCKNLIDTSFDKYTGDRLTIDEIKHFAEKRNILCAYYSGTLCGILRFENRNNNIWLDHISVDPEFRGKGIASALISEYIKINSGLGDSRYQLWVVQDNSNAISLYKKFGFAYGNKSSVSMLKN